MKHIVGVADMIVSGQPEDVIVTHALGSCLGITVYDPHAQVGGLLHVMLPLSTIDSQKATEAPCMFVDTGVPRLFLEAYRLGAQKGRLQVRVAGGAAIRKNDEGEDHFQIGKRNMVMLRKLLWKNGVLIAAEDVGGSDSRTMTLTLATGEVTIRANGTEGAL